MANTTFSWTELRWVASVKDQENVFKIGDQIKKTRLVYFLTSSQLPTLNLACCPEARNDTNTNCCPRTRTPIFLLSDRKSGLRGVGVWAWSVQLHDLILLPPSSRLRPPQASILNLLHSKQEPRSYVIYIFAVQLTEILLIWGIISY